MKSVFSGKIGEAIALAPMREKGGVEIRVVAFCDLEERTEFQLATDLLETGEGGLSNAEIAEITEWNRIYC